MSEPSIDNQFFVGLKRQTETRWSKANINPAIAGFQFLRGTRWNPGLTHTQIGKYEQEIKVSFPNDFRSMLRIMNGTDIPTLNIYGFSGETHRTGYGVYAYPRDLEIVRRRIEDIQEDRDAIEEVLREQEFVLETSAALVPIYGHRYIVCASDPGQSTVLSIYGADAIVYGETLQEYLVDEFLS